MALAIAKPIAGILTTRRELLGDVLLELGDNFGKTDIVGEWRAFDHTDYYADEMGEGLFRNFVSFEALVPPESAVKFKRWTSEVEDKHRRDGRRSVNIDAGYLDSNKVVLITGKRGGHKIALAPGIWADMLLWYNKGWVAMPWAFPDFKDGGFFPTFMKMRARFKAQIRTINP